MENKDGEPKEVDTRFSENHLCKRKGCYPLGKDFSKYNPNGKEDTPHVMIFMEGDCTCNVNRALKEINAFEWEGDYRAEARNRLKELLEERMKEELGQYLGRAKHERRGEGGAEDYRNGSYPRHLLTEIGDLVLRIRRGLAGDLYRGC